MSSQNILITGISGQDGIFLANQFLKDDSKNFKIYGISRQDPLITINKINSIGVDSQDLKIIDIDLTDSLKVKNLISDLKPAQIFNLSGPSSVYESINNSKYFQNTINSIFDNLTNSCLELKQFPNFFQACSSEMFSNKNKMPLNENSVFDPRSPYAKAKFQVFNKLNKLKELYDWNIKAGIMFNHESEFRDQEYLFMKIFNSAKLIKSKKLEYLEIGSLDICRDWSFAGDVSNAMFLMNQSDNRNNFVIGSGKAISVKEVIEQIFSLFEINLENNIIVNPKLLRFGDPQTIISDPSMIKESLNWNQKLTFEDLIERIFKRV